MPPPSPPRSEVPTNTAAPSVAGDAGDAGAWTYTVSVKSLCEFSARRGDLDRRYTPSATALEGQLGQAAVTARRGTDYESEVPLEGRHGPLRVRGRADGFDGRRQCLEEIKTLRVHADDIAEHRRHLHWAQLETYGALFCRTRGLAEIDLALVYVDAATMAETVQRKRVSAADLEAAFGTRCGLFIDWAHQEAMHRAARDSGLAALPFPPGDFRPGQRGLAEAVYRAAVNQRCLLAQAPTGIGKTIGTLFPLLRAMPGQKIDKIGFLTNKGSGRFTALEALASLRDRVPGRALRVLVLASREQACEHPDKACHPDSCPLARGFHDRLPAARAEAVTAGWLDAPAQRTVALRHGICPYYLGQELLRWTDVVVGDVFHAFDPNGQLFGLAQALDWRIALLVDEAHNLVDRARQMHSAALGLAQVRTAMGGAPAVLRPALRRLLLEMNELVDAQDGDYQAFEAVPDSLGQALQAVNAALGEYLQRQPLATGPLLNFYFEALRMQRTVDRFGPHSVFDIQRGESAGEAGAEAMLSIRNVVPAPFLRPRFMACHSVTLFSATLGSQAYARDLLGLPDGSGWIDVPPPFPAEHLCVRVADDLSTRYPHRSATLDALVDLMARQYAEHPGNYLAFFSSFDYLERAAGRLAERHPALPLWPQSRAMGEAARQGFLARFAEGGRGIGLAVLGGVFAEGVDLPGSRLIGAFITTLGLPPVTPVQAQFRQRLDAMFGTGHGYADLVPGLQKVVQAAGRVLRTPEDRGWLWLMDDRYLRPEVARLLPGWWGLSRGPCAPAGAFTAEGPAHAAGPGQADDQPDADRRQWPRPRH